jgi:regulatory protein YycI of two-component signal transduction system YycFG
MDWSRTKNILILVFVVLNIFLGINLGSYVSAANISKSKIVSTIKILKNNNVNLQCSINSFSGNDIMLTYEDSDFNMDKVKGILKGKHKQANINISDNILTFTDNNPIEIVNTSSKEKVDKAIRQFINNLGIPVKEFVIDEYTEDKKQNMVKVVYRQVYKKHLVFDNYVNVTIVNNTVKSMEISYFEPLRTIGRDTQVTPAYKILLDNFSYEKNETITSIDIGFKGSGGEEDRQPMESLVWRIKVIKSGNSYERYFRALNGEEIKGADEAIK